MLTNGLTRDDAASSSARSSEGNRVLGHPVAFFFTAMILLCLFGFTFVVNPARVAPSTDPAFYSWRIETLISEKPATFLQIMGPFHSFTGGYRVAGATLGGYLRQIAGLSLLKTTVALVVGEWTLIALLLGGFAYRNRRDPLIFHVVVAGSASLLLTPPFLGYADNVLCLIFLAAALWFVSPSSQDWRARVGLGIFLTVAGFTHPTTLAIFCASLLVMAVVRFVLTRFDLKGVIRFEGPVLATAALALLVMFASWSIGIWGIHQSLSEAASPPPKSAKAFTEKTIEWLQDMHPAWNGPLLLIGILGLLVLAWRKGTQQDLARVSIVWLAPLVGLLGFVVGLAYPYFRFLNSTLAWVLLISLGCYFVMRSSLDLAHRGGFARLASIGVIVVVVLIGANFAKLASPKWNRPRAGWIPNTQKRDLDTLRSALGRLNVSDRPVVFVLDLQAHEDGKIYSFAKTNINRSRYGLPDGDIDRGFYYLGSLDDLLAGRPTQVGAATYDRLSRAYLEDAKRGLATSGERPIIVLERKFNYSGTNAKYFHTKMALPSPRDADIWWVGHGRVTTSQGTVLASHHRPRRVSAWHLARVVGGVLLLLIPGLLWTRRLIPDPNVAEMLGMVPALAMATLALSAIVVLAVARAPFSGELPWVSLALATLLPLLPVPLSRSGLTRLTEAPAP